MRAPEPHSPYACAIRGAVFALGVAALFGLSCVSMTESRAKESALNRAVVDVPFAALADTINQHLHLDSPCTFTESQIGSPIRCANTSDDSFYIVQIETARGGTEGFSFDINRHFDENDENGSERYSMRLEIINALDPAQATEIQARVDRTGDRTQRTCMTTRDFACGVLEACR